MTLQQRKVFVPTSSSGKIRIIFKQTLQSPNLTSRDTHTADDWPSRFANSEKSSEYRLNIFIFFKKKANSWKGRNFPFKWKAKKEDK